MLLFKKITWRNFLSTGNSPTTITFDDCDRTLIVGTNGSGKSTLLDALTFALFGKPHRNINKPQLVNSINQKNCLVSIEFSVNGKEYVIHRGIKPNIFEIWEDGLLINQDSHTRDYQRYLEVNIIQLNYRVFNQVVVLGSGNFVPFMQLPSHARREVIEELLDIGIFTRMGILMKDKNASLRDLIEANKLRVKSVHREIDLQEEHIRQIQGMADQNAEEVRTDIAHIEDNIADLRKRNEELMAGLDDEHDKLYDEWKVLSDKSDENRRKHIALENEMKAVAKHAKFFDENTSCPTCEQEIDDKLRSDKKAEARVEAKQLKCNYDHIKELRKTLNDAMAVKSERLEELKGMTDEIRENDKRIDDYRKHITRLERRLDDKSEDHPVSEAINKKAELQDDLRKLKEEGVSLIEERVYNDAIIEMLKDGGIKAKVIRQYLPLMNKLINGFLQVLDFFVSFHLDDNFNETLKSRHRDNFSYASFSEGQKARIDLALLFAWKQVAKLKNSVDTNLLILDETFDSSLDADGVDNLLKILETLPEDSSVFVISHKQDILEGRFARKITFQERKNFSFADIQTK